MCDSRHQSRYLPVGRKAGGRLAAGSETLRSGWLPGSVLIRQDQLLGPCDPQAVLLPPVDDDDLALAVEQRGAVEPGDGGRFASRARRGLVERGHELLGTPNTRSMSSLT